MLLGKTLDRSALTSTGLSPSTAPLSNGLQLHTNFLTARSAGRQTKVLPQPPTHNPCRVSHRHGLASSDFARHYSRNHYCFLFLSVLRCFTSRRSLHTPYIFRCGSLDMTPAGFPHSEILGSRFVCQLPEAYRRLQRPSSAPSAKASTLCP